MWGCGDWGKPFPAVPCPAQHAEGPALASPGLPHWSSLDLEEHCGYHYRKQPLHPTVLCLYQAGPGGPPGWEGDGSLSYVHGLVPSPYWLLALPPWHSSIPDRVTGLRWGSPPCRVVELSDCMAGLALSILESPFWCWMRGKPPPHSQPDMALLYIAQQNLLP